MIYPKGEVDFTIDYKNGKTEHLHRKNVVVRTGRVAIANGIANFVNDPFDFYVDQMLFGTDGTSGGVPKFVEETRNGLFGPVLLSKNVIASIDDAAPTTVIFTSVIAFDEVVGSVLSEMALQLATDDLYSMVTFPDLTKTGDMQITFNWRVSFL